MKKSELRIKVVGDKLNSMYNNPLIIKPSKITENKGLTTEYDRGEFNTLIEIAYGAKVEKLGDDATKSLFLMISRLGNTLLSGQCLVDHPTVHKPKGLPELPELLDLYQNDMHELIETELSKQKWEQRIANSELNAFKEMTQNRTNEEYEGLVADVERLRQSVRSISGKSDTVTTVLQLLVRDGGKWFNDMLLIKLALDYDRLELAPDNAVEILNDRRNLFIQLSQGTEYIATTPLPTPTNKAGKKYDKVVEFIGQWVEPYSVIPILQSNQSVADFGEAVLKYSTNIVYKDKAGEAVLMYLTPNGGDLSIDMWEILLEILHYGWGPVEKTVTITKIEYINIAKGTSSLIDMTKGDIKGNSQPLPLVGTAEQRDHIDLYNKIISALINDVIPHVPTPPQLDESNLIGIVATESVPPVVDIDPTKPISQLDKLIMNLPKA